VHGGNFHGPPYSYDVKGEKKHDFSLAKAFMPLSTPFSEELVIGGSSVPGIVIAFFYGTSSFDRRKF